MGELDRQIGGQIEWMNGLTDIDEQELPEGKWDTVTKHKIKHSLYFDVRLNWDNHFKKVWKKQASTAQNKTLSGIFKWPHLKTFTN